MVSKKSYCGIVAPIKQFFKNNSVSPTDPQVKANVQNESTKRVRTKTARQLVDRAIIERAVKRCGVL